MRILTLLFLLIAFSGGLAAQSISGVVTDDVGNPLIGASVIIKDTERGTTTDFDGKFTLDVQDGDEYLVISYTGYESVEQLILDCDNCEIVLTSSALLTEVVITALGMGKDEKSLGYAVQKVESSRISGVKPINVTNALAGKVSGVYITGSSNGPTASSNITIRGQSSLTGNSQALFVVNGMPITNGLYAPGDGLNGSTTIDFGNSAQVITADDVESVTILKGPAAAALYGSRASNGVVVVNTKTGRDTEGWGVSVNSSTMFESILKLPDYQNEYGPGGYGFYSYNGGTTYTAGADGVNYYDAFGENWGPALNGTSIKQWNSNGNPAPFTPAPDNVRDFFRTGVSSINNFSFSNYNRDGDFRVSYTNTSRRGLVPNTNLQRNSLSTSVGKNLFDAALNFRVNAMYINSQSGNVPNAGYDESSSVMYGWLWLPRSVNIGDLKDYWKPGLENVQQSYTEELWVNNPWFVANENTNSFQENRLVGNIEVDNYITSNLNAKISFGTDVKDEQRQFRRATSTKAIPGQFGSYREDEISFVETNLQLLLSYDAVRTDKIGLEIKAGGNVMRQRSNVLSAYNSQLLQPGIFTLSNNRADILVENPKARKGINSAFAVMDFSYDNFIYLDLTGRNDWSSTLPKSNNSYFYPSASLSVVISEKLKLSEKSPLSFLKVRAAYAQVGNDTDPYLLTNTYEPGVLFGANPTYSVNPFAANPDLRPERTTALEAGVDVRFKDNRLGLDVTYYDMLSKDQIIFLPVALSSGNETRLANGGEIRNRGVEVSLYAVPVATKDFSWEIGTNLGHNRAVVEKLPEGVEGSYPIVADIYPGDEGSADMELVAIEGELLGQIWGLGFQRDASGNIIHEDGRPLMTTEKVSAGSYQPKARLGISNTLIYKDFSLDFLFDGQIGGKVYSRTHALMNTGGTITNNDDPLLNLSTLDGRDNYTITYDGDGNPVYTGDPGAGVIGPGVMYDTDGNLVPNTVAIPTRDYFYAYYGNGFNRDNVEAATYNATYFKLRELRLSYQLPSALVKKMGFDGGRLSLIGRNLLLFSKVPSIDPETFSVRNGLFVNGYESTQLPSTRSFGFSLNFSL